MVLIVIAVGREHGHKHSLPRTDGWGDPFVTDAQVAAVKVGMNGSEVSRLLGGPGDTGGDWSTGQYIGIHNYPITGTGDPGPYPMANDNTIYWRICVRVADNIVVAKRRVDPSWEASGCW